MSDDRLILSEIKQHEFRGNFPQVNTYSTVDLDMLTKGDDDPFFVVLPIARVGEISGNGLVYDEELVSELEKQLPGVGGIRGHNFDKTSFPTETHDVVGHTRTGDTLWAKIYIPPGENREDMRRRKARGGAIGTSIFGPYQKREALSNGKWRARGFKLESVDFGLITRTALNLGGEFAVMSELQTETEDEQGATEMDREQIIAELKVSDIPQELREAIISEHATAHEAEGQVAELRAENEQYQNVIAELKGQLAEVNAVKFAAELDNRLTEMVKLEALRPVARRYVVAELQGEHDTEKAEQALAEYLDSDEYKNLAKALVAEHAGPAAFVGAAMDENWRDKLVENSAKIAHDAGVL